MNISLTALALTALTLVGCAIDPPAPLQDDREFLASHPFPEKADWDPRAFPDMAIGPIVASYLSKSEAVYSALGEVGNSWDTTPDSDKAQPYSYDTPQFDRDALQRELASVLTWALYGSDRPVKTIAPGKVRQVDLAEIPPNDREARIREYGQRYLCQAATELDTPLFVHVDLVQNSIAFVHRTPMSFLSQLIFWFPPVIFIPDQIYELRTTARFTIVHARTGSVVYQTSHTAIVSETFSLVNRGWCLSGQFGLDPFFRDPSSGEYEDVRAALWPHAVIELERRLVMDLRANLAKQLAISRMDLTTGTDAAARTFALVIGHNGDHRTNAAHIELNYAESDAASFAALLRQRNGLGPQDDRQVVLLTHDFANVVAIRDAIHAMARRLLGNDSLIIYYAGFGLTDRFGEPVLEFGGGHEEVPLKTLADWCESELVGNGNRPSVVFILDTSFAPNARSDDPNCRSLTVAGSPPLSASTYLAPLANRNFKWSVLAAAGPTGVAFEYLNPNTDTAKHGFLTRSLLSGLMGAARGTEAGAITSTMLFDYVERRVPQIAAVEEFAEQRPEHHGTSMEIVIGR